MVCRLWKWILLAIIAVPLAVWFYDRANMICWVGQTDLEVEFVITEAGSDNPIPGARIEVQSDGGFYEEREKQQFELFADDSGIARKVCRGSMCFGTQSGLKFKDTYVVHLPFWLFRLSAPGYEPSEWVELDVLEYRRQTRKVGPQRAKLVVPLSLHKT